MSHDNEEYDVQAEVVRYLDPEADRADAFGVLALRIDNISDENIHELGLQMLRQIIRSIKTPGDAEVMQLKGGKL